MEIMTISKRLSAGWGITDNMNRSIVTFPFYVLCLFYQLYSEICFFVLGRPDVFKRALVSYIGATIFSNVIQICACFRRREDLRRLIQYVEQYVNQFVQTDAAGIHHFRKTESAFTFATKVFVTGVFWSALMNIAQPYALWIYAWLTDTVTENTFRSPFGDMYYFWDERISPAREICYILNVIVVLVACIGYFTIAVLLANPCFYLVALYDFVGIQLRNANTEVTNRSRIIEKCIRGHLRILRITDAYNDIFSSVIFIQLCASMFSLCTCVLTALYSKTSDYLLIALNFMALTSSLFVLCATGTYVTTASDSLRDTIYQLNWYEYSIREQKMLQLFLLRMQSPSSIEAYNYFICSHVTFQKIISKVFSSLAFLKRVVETD